MNFTQIAQNKKIVIMIALGILALISLLYGIFSGPGHRRAIPQQETAINAGNGPAGMIAQEDICQPARRAKRTQFKSWKRDPFIPKGLPGVQYSKFALSGILASGKELKAMIGDTIVGKGDKVDANTTVVEVRKDRVILNDGTKNFELKLVQ